MHLREPYGAQQNFNSGIEPRNECLRKARAHLLDMGDTKTRLNVPQGGCI